MAFELNLGGRHSMDVCRSALEMGTVKFAQVGEHKLVCLVGPDHSSVAEVEISLTPLDMDVTAIQIRALRLMEGCASALKKQIRNLYTLILRSMSKQIWATEGKLIVSMAIRNI
ncbi:MAG TPA: hypothetical protein V6D17_05060 [Candidatus Obscuribacterales bacterium]